MGITVEENYFTDLDDARAEIKAAGQFLQEVDAQASGGTPIHWHDIGIHFLCQRGHLPFPGSGDRRGAPVRPGDQVRPPGADPAHRGRPRRLQGRRGPDEGDLSGAVHPAARGTRGADRGVGASRRVKSSYRLDPGVVGDGLVPSRRQGLAPGSTRATTSVAPTVEGDKRRHRRRLTGGASGPRATTPRPRRNNRVSAPSAPECPGRGSRG